MSIIERRRLLSASLSDAQDNGILVPNIGARFVGCKFTTRLNAGYDTLTTNVLARGMSETFTYEEAVEIMRGWRFGILRVYMQSELVWMGRIQSIQLGDVAKDTLTGLRVPISISCVGFWGDLARIPIDIEDIFFDETQVPDWTALDIIKDVLSNPVYTTNIINNTFQHLLETGVRVVPLKTSIQDYPLDVIVDLLKLGSSDQIDVSNLRPSDNGNVDNHKALYPGKEYAIALWNPQDGLHMLARGVGPERWVQSIAGTGLTFMWNGEEYASKVSATFNDSVAGSSKTSSTSSDYAVELHHGVVVEKAISVQATSPAAALTARDAFLATHSDPIGWSGSMNITPTNVIATMTNAEGASEPAWRAKAGDIIRLIYAPLQVDPLIHDDPFNMSAMIDATDYDVDSGTLSVTLDQQSVASRLTEKTADIRVLAKAIAPRDSSTLAQISSTTTLDTTNGTIVHYKPSNFKYPDDGDAGVVELDFSENKKIYVTITAVFANTALDPNAIGDSTLLVGYTINNSSQPSFSYSNFVRSFNYKSAGYTQVTGTWKTRVKIGKRRFRVWLAAGDVSRRVEYVSLEIKG